jgi:hypothetical protein
MVYKLLTNRLGERQVFLICFVESRRRRSHPPRTSTPTPTLEGAILTLPCKRTTRTNPKATTPASPGFDGMLEKLGMACATFGRRDVREVGARESDFRPKIPASSFYLCCDLQTSSEPVAGQLHHPSPHLSRRPSVPPASSPTKPPISAKHSDPGAPQRCCSPHRSSRACHPRAAPLQTSCKIQSPK